MQVCNRSRSPPGRPCRRLAACAGRLALAAQSGRCERGRAGGTAGGGAWTTEWAAGGGGKGRLIFLYSGPNATRSRSTAATTSSATSTSGRGRCRSRTRRCGSPAAARSRRGSGARRWTTSTRISPTSATRRAARQCTASGTRWPRQGDGVVPRAGRIFLRPLPARRSALGDAARLYHRSDAARRRAGPDRPRRQPAGAAGGARDDAHGGHRRARLCDQRLARRGRRAADRRSRPTSTSGT